MVFLEPPAAPNPFGSAGHEQTLLTFVNAPMSANRWGVAPTWDGAKLLSLVMLDDAALLKTHLHRLCDTWSIKDVVKQLWYFSLVQAKPNTFSMLCTLSVEDKFRFSVCELLDSAPPDFQTWALTIPVARNLWLSQTKPLVAAQGYRLEHGLRVLEANASIQELKNTLDAKSDSFHHYMRIFIREYATQTLMKNGLFLHTIAYYEEPTKKHLRVAATGPYPVYDLKRMELHWPGIEGAVAALHGLGLPRNACETRIRAMISNKQVAKAAKEMKASLPEGLLEL